MLLSCFYVSTWGKVIIKKAIFHNLPKSGIDNLWVTLINARRKRHLKDIFGLVDSRYFTSVTLVTSTSLGSLPRHLLKHITRLQKRIHSIRTHCYEIKLTYFMPTSSPLFNIHCSAVLNTLSYSGSIFCQKTNMNEKLSKEQESYHATVKHTDTAKIKQFAAVVKVKWLWSWMFRFCTASHIGKVISYTLWAAMGLANMPQIKGYTKSHHHPLLTILIYIVKINSATRRCSLKTYFRNKTSYKPSWKLVL